MPDKGWSRTFDDPVPSPRRRRAAHPPRRGQLYLQAPEARARCAPWLAAIQALMLVVEHGGDTMLPRTGIMRAMYLGGAVPTPRKKRRRSTGSSGNRAEVIPLDGAARAS